MKKTDIAMIVLIAGLSMFGAYLVVNSLVAGLKPAAVQVPTAQPIKTSTTPIQPDPTVFNSGAINPTVQINIGGSNT